MKDPSRSCIGCRAVKEKSLLLRYVLSPGGELVLDYHVKLPGRGVYVCPDLACLESAVKSRGFLRAFKKQGPLVTLEALVDVLVKKAKDRIDSLVVVAVKAGKASLGTVAVEEGMKKGKMKCLLGSPELSDKAKESWLDDTGRKALPIAFIPFVGTIDKLTGGKKIIGITDNSISAEISRELELIRKLRPGIQE